MQRRLAITFSIILVIFGFTLWSIFPIQGTRFGREGFRLGIDLVGGVDLKYQALFTENMSSADRSAAMDREVLVIQKRIDAYGVTEPVIRKLDKDRLEVQLPGFTDIDAAKKLVEQTGFLEFREVELNQSGSAVTLADYLNSSQNGTLAIQFFDQSESGNRIFADEKGNPAAFLAKDAQGKISFSDVSGNPLSVETLKKGTTDLLSWIPARGDDNLPLTGNLLASATTTLQQQLGTEIEVDITWNPLGTEIFDQIAKRLYNANANDFSPTHLLGIFLDNVRISAAQVRAPKFEGKAVISGSFTADEATQLATLLKSGSLPVQLKQPPLYQEKISATLGANFIQRSVLAGIIGMILIMLFMIVYYRLPGLLASLSLIFYGTLILTVFKLWPVTLSLSGLAGFVVSLGMAVDANVLIFERMREELRTGRTLGAAIEAGFHRAWSAIFDSNATTVLACLILIWLASSVVSSAQVMGFAITLLIGVLVSMFTAITVTRTLLRLFVGTSIAKKTSLFTPDWSKK